MSEWEERVSTDSNPARRVEHGLRYALVAELVHDAPLWLDLGCGTGVTAADALGSSAPRRTVLVDRSAEALEQAARELMVISPTTVQADLGTAEGVATVREMVGEDTGGVVTCFETLAHLESFVPSVDLLIELAAEHTVVLSVPNDAYWSIENPFHPTMWGEGAFEELVSLIPGPYIRLDQVPLAGSAIVAPGAAVLELAPATLEAERVPSHFVLALGPQADRLVPAAATRMADAADERRWERERSSELALMAARLRELESAS
jgi:SAM-dependent methyltransferase